MRRLVAVLVLLTACGGEGVRHSFKPPLEGQSPSEPVQPAKAVVAEPPAPGSAAADSPTWLRTQAPVEWTMPPGWEAELSTKPQRLIEVTLEKNGPGGMPIQFLILNGVDDHPTAKQASLDRWETFYHEDVPRSSSTTEHDGLRITRFKVHGQYQGPTFANSNMIDEPNWTMDCGWVEGPAGSIMFRIQGPDAIVKPAQEKVDALLASMRARQKQ